MSKITTLFVFLFIFYGNFIALQAQTDPAHPNVILIIADDLGVDVSNGYQNNTRMPTTPTLDSLRANGLTFMNAWSAPVCTPTRACIMSGKYGTNTGVMRAPGNLDTSHTSLFREIDAQIATSYSDAVIGKWHISQPVDYSHPQQHGVDHYDGVFDSGVPDYYNWDKVTNSVQSVDTNYVTSYFSDEAINWVNAQNSPWFLWLAEVAPHTPFHVPPSNLYSIAQVNTNRQKFIASIEAMDAEIGRLFDNIPDSVLENTLIIYVGDNGTTGSVIQNFPTTHGKSTLYQGGIHVPMIVAGPMVTRKNETEDALVHVVDIYATIIEALGHDLPGGIYNSYSFHDLLSNPNATGRPYNYIDYDDGTTTGYAIRNERYKLIDITNNAQEFYDLQNDYLEATDLMGSLTSEQDSIRLALMAEASAIQNGWSCNDLIQNGDETGIDCGGTSSCANCTTQLNDHQVPTYSITIYPNPSAGIFSVYTDAKKIDAIEVFDLSGTQVYSNNSVGSNHQTIDLSELSAQLYLLKLSINGQSFTKKIILDK